MLALDGFEMISIGAILLVLFIWGPQRLPEMAKAIGEAKREFEKAAKGIPPPDLSRAQLTTPAPSQDPIITAAKSLGIITAGKTKEELTTQILERSAQ